MDKPTSTLNTTDFRPALLWVMGQMEKAHNQDILTTFDQQFGNLIPESQRRLSESDGKELWRTNVIWSSADLVKAGLLKRIPGGKGVWAITKAGRELLAQPLTFQEARKEVLQRINNPPSEASTTYLPTTLGSSLRPYVKLVTHLNDPAYTPDQIVERLGRISPPIAPGLTEKPDAEHLVHELLRLRLLEPLEDGRYRRWPHLADSTEPNMLRYAALTMLVPASDGSYLLPILTAPLDGQPHPAAEWPLGETLPQWYEEAGLVVSTGERLWRGLPDALESRDGDTPTIQAINTFLRHLQQARSSEHDLPPIRDDALHWLDPDTLEERIREIQRELLIDRTTILRIYRALVAGQHVILSGPPGTGKTHLAKLLPRILWRDSEDTIILTLRTDPQRPPTEPPAERRLRRQGYAVEVVTATEDWGIRHVIGGIAPRLERTDQGNSLVYAIRHGCLTSTVLRNYTGYDGETVPAITTLRRREIADDAGQRYRGRWLVIDEFTRAPVDAAFGSLLTTLGGQRSPLLVPTDRGDVAVPLPKDFRIIGTLNSFDRHFLNQMSEAMKRRFVFIDILPPGREHSEAEQGMAIYRALRTLAEQRMLDVTTDLDDGSAVWEDLLSVARAEDDPGSTGPVRYKVQTDDTEVGAVLRDLWRIFRAIRVYRQLGTAQAEAVYSALLTGSSVGMDWTAALDAALADTLADQLQVLNRDEQRVLLAFLEHAASPEQFTEQVRGILHTMPGPRQLAHLSLLKDAAPNGATPPLDPTKLASLTPAHLGSLFDVGTPLLVNHDSLFARRLRAFVNERGL